MRAAGKIPAVLYGRGIDATALTVSPRELKAAVSGPLRLNTVVALEVEGDDTEYRVMVRDHQYDPISRELLHVDFLTVDLNTALKVEIPLNLIGRSQGEQAGGVLAVTYRTVPMECLPAAILPFIEFDISALEIDDRVTVADLVLPEGAEVSLPPETTLASIQTPRKEEEKVEEEEEGVEGEEGAEGEAPADGAKPAEGEGEGGEAKSEKKD